VPDLHDEASAQAVAVGVAEAVAHDDDAGAEGGPQALPARLQHRGDAEAARGGRVVLVAREPEQLAAWIGARRGAVQRERSLSDTGTRAEHPEVVAAGDDQAREGAERVAGEGEDLLRIAAGEGDDGRGLRHAPE
jgi:hypothetical protein